MTTAPAPVQYAHIDHDEKGTPFIVGSTMKVVELVMAQRAHGWSPEELHFQHPELSLGEIHSALAYYWDHQAELDEDIENRSRRVDELRQEIGSSPLAEELELERMVLVGKDRDTFLDALLDPPEPTAKLVAALRRYRESVE